MPDFTVIEGGGKSPPPDDFNRRLAAQAFRVAMVEMLRAIVRGNDPQHRVIQSLADFYGMLAATQDQLGVIDDVIATMHANIPKDETEFKYRRAIPEIIESSLRLIAEKSAHDEFARSRANKNREKLESAILSYTCGLEDRSREDGGSYLKDILTTHFGRKKPSGWDRVR